MSATEHPAPENARQRVEKVVGSRRARLTPAPGSTAEPVPADEEADAAASDSSEGSGPNDARLRADKPPHY
ncbi:hypothetical protein [Microbacterium sp. CJ88]|uniref:hypothetical protein n=1 Tax=Microbacterium sp. CJ88 TaxID=3445672 RepID=UPI003F659B1C